MGKAKDLLELELLLIGPGKIPGKLHPMLSFNSSFSQISLFFSNFFLFFFLFHVLNVWILKKGKKKTNIVVLLRKQIQPMKGLQILFFRDGVLTTPTSVSRRAAHPVPTTYDIKDTLRLSIPRLLATSSPGSEKRNDVACKSFFTGAVFFVSSVSRLRGRATLEDANKDLCPWWRDEWGVDWVVCSDLLKKKKIIIKKKKKRTEIYFN